MLWVRVMLRTGWNRDFMASVGAVDKGDVLNGDKSDGSGRIECGDTSGGLNQEELLGEVLEHVSRAFYLSIRVLPGKVRLPIGLGYLLARAADTLADNPYVGTSERRADLGSWSRILRERRPTVQNRSFWEHLRLYVRENEAVADKLSGAGKLSGEGAVNRAKGCPLLAAAGLTRGEARLLERLDDAYELYLHLDPFALEQVNLVVQTLISGMQLDLEFFPGAFRREAQLEQYTFLVAGCVGQFWSRITSHYLGAIEPEKLPEMEKLGVEFGKALQYVNVLRDMPKDLECGRLYVPLKDLEEFLPPVSDEVKKELFSYKEALLPYIHKALEHFRAALHYIQKTPKSAFLLRLSNIWPVAIGLGTLLEMVRSPHWPCFGRRVKVSRFWVYAMILASTLLVWSNRALEFCFGYMEKLIDKAEKKILNKKVEDVPESGACTTEKAPPLGATPALCPG